MTATLRLVETPAPKRRSRPIPSEHGAWAMLYAPLMVGLAAITPDRVAEAGLLVMTVTAAFIAQELIVRWDRRPLEPNEHRWFSVSILAAVGALALLVVGAGLWGLMPLALVGMVFLVVRLAVRRHSGRRGERSLGLELGMVVALTLSAPAGRLVAVGHWELGALWVWLGCVAYFWGAVWYARAAIAVRRATAETRRDVWWARVLPLWGYHLLLGAAAALVALGVGGSAGLAIGLSCAPAVLRALLGGAVLARRPLSVRALGWGEVAGTVWAVAWSTAVVRMLLAVG